MNPLLRLRRLSERPDWEERSPRSDDGTTPSERLEQALELSDVARALALSVRARWVAAPANDLADKAGRYPTRVRTG